MFLCIQIILTYIFIEMYNTPLQYGAYVYPRWGKALGVCMGATCCLQIPIWAIVAISKESGTLKNVSTVRPIFPLSVITQAMLHGYTNCPMVTNKSVLK